MPKAHTSSAMKHVPAPSSIVATPKASAHQT